MVSYNFLTLFKHGKLLKHVFPDFMKHGLYLEEWLILWQMLDTHWDKLQSLEAQNTVF